MAAGRADAARGRARRTARCVLDGETLTCERIKAAVDAGLHEPRRRRRRDHRQPRRAGCDRPRRGLRPDPAGRDRGRRPLPARQGDGLLRRHDAHVRRRRAAGRGRASGTGSRRRRSTLARGDPAGRRAAGRAAPPRLRVLPGARLPDAAAQGARRGAPRRLLPRDSATASGSTSTRSRASAATARARRRRRRRASSRGSTGRASAACRLEDLVLVTEDGCEKLTDFPYDLEL